MLLMNQFWLFQRCLCRSLDARGFAMGLAVCLLVVVHFDCFYCRSVGGCCCGVWVVVSMNLGHHRGADCVVGSRCIVEMVGRGCSGG